MGTHFELTTERLHLRQWHDADYPCFAELNADAEVMEYFPATLDSVQSNALASHLRNLIHVNGYGFWAVSTRLDGKFVGFVGLKAAIEYTFGEGIEIGWRLARLCWGKGYATEAAIAATKFAFENLQQDKLFAFTAVGNTRSIAVMQRIGMEDCKQNFPHPKIDPTSKVSEHVLYRITRASYQDKPMLNGANPLIVPVQSNLD